MFPSDIVRFAVSDGVTVPPPTPEALRFYVTGNVWWVIRTLWAIGVPLVMLALGGGPWLERLAARLTRRPFWQPPVAFAVLSVLLFCINLPLAFYLGYIRLHAYGLSNQTIAKWGSDRLIAFGLYVLVGAIAATVAFALLRRWPRGWWAAAGALACPLIAFGALIVPLWVDPLFNDFQPMERGPLEQELRQLAAQAGAGEVAIFVVEKSVDTTAVNAYVTGLGGTKRIVLWDTLLDALSPDQVAAVAAHELGHYVLRHVSIGIVFYSGLTLAGLGLVHLAAGSAVHRWGRRFGITHLGQPAALPLLLAMAYAVSVVLAPPGLAFSRYLEREADRFALELTRDNQAVASAYAALQTSNLSNPWPGPVYVFMRASHPPLGARITFANTYQPWETGAPLRHGHRITPPAETAAQAR